MPAVTQMKRQNKRCLLQSATVKDNHFFKEATLDWRHGPSFMLGIVLNYRECTSQRNGARMHVGAFFTHFSLYAFFKPRSSSAARWAKNGLYFREAFCEKKRGLSFSSLFALSKKIQSSVRISMIIKCRHSSFFRSFY